MFFKSSLIFLVCLGSTGDQWVENFYLKVLPGGKRTFIEISGESELRKGDIEGHHFDIFPKEIAKIASLSSEIHGFKISLSQGIWRDKFFGSPPLQIPPAGASIAILTKNSTNPQKQTFPNWFSPFLFQSTSLTCGSYALLEDTKKLHITFDEATNDKWLIGRLPQETICTENVVPWSKLLPCGLNGGIFSFIDTKKLAESQFKYLEINFEKETSDKKSKVKFSVGWIETDNVFNEKSRAIFKNLQKYSISDFFNKFPNSCPPRSSLSVEIWDEKRHNFFISNLESERLRRTNEKIQSRHYPMPVDIQFEILRLQGFVERAGHRQRLKINNKGFVPYKVSLSIPRSNTWKALYHTLSVEGQDSDGITLWKKDGPDLIQYSRLKVFQITTEDQRSNSFDSVSFEIPAQSQISLDLSLLGRHIPSSEYSSAIEKGMELIFGSAIIRPQMNISDALPPAELRILGAGALLIHIADESMVFNVIALACTAIMLVYTTMFETTVSEEDYLPQEELEKSKKS
eukprot:GHVP01069249.1.p1 GENE.GHVP01069249.1~~GHVP01069249.1.p1  ORF type:complete len:516 (+),score=107.21 GHVP01069249.1:39-1586(+)